MQQSDTNTNVKSYLSDLRIAAENMGYDISDAELAQFIPHALAVDLPVLQLARRATMATKKLSLPPDVNDTTERFPRQSTHRVIRVPRSMPSEDDLRRIKGNRLKDVLLSIAFGAGITAGITGLMVAIAYIMLRM